MEAWLNALHLHWAWPTHDGMLSSWIDYKHNLESYDRDVLCHEIASAEAAILSSCLPSEPLLPFEGLTCPKWIIIRTYPHGSWTLRDVKNLWHRHIKSWNVGDAPNYSANSLDLRIETTSNIYSTFAERMCLIFTGARVHTQHMGGALLETNCTEIPRYPTSVPPADRNVSWTYTTETGIYDTCFSSMTTWWKTIQYLLKADSLLTAFEFCFDIWMVADSSNLGHIPTPSPCRSKIPLHP